jgi:tRNA 2-thiocytidine biosynthesis protein TtcA
LQKAVAKKKEIRYDKREKEEEHMEWETEFSRKIMQDLTGCYHKVLWNPFAKAVRTYELIQPGDKIAVCVSGGKDSMLLAKLMQLQHRYGKIPFELIFLSMDPGYLPENRKCLKENAARLGLPLEMIETNIFRSLEETGRSPCGLCSRLRRGVLYRQAQERGCNKIALGHHFNDVIETTLMGMLYGGQIQGMLPKLHSSSYPGMEVIRPLYCVKEKDIIQWQTDNGLHFLRCACLVTRSEDSNSKRKRVKDLIAQLKEETPRVDQNIFHSITKADVDTLIGYKLHGENHFYLEEYDK